MKIFFFCLLVPWMAFGYECSLQTEFYRSLPVFLGTTGTMEISTEKILVLTNRGTGVVTDTKANVTRYSYPGERIETYIVKTIEENGDVYVTTVPKYFNCNVRHAHLRGNKVVSLSYCSIDGCRHINPQVCEVLTKNFNEDKVRGARNPLATIFEVETQVKAMTKPLHQENSILMREFHKLEGNSPRVLGVSMTEFETEEGISPTFGLLQLGGILASETDYCRRIQKDSLFWKADMRPSKFLRPIKKSN